MQVVAREQVPQRQDLGHQGAIRRRKGGSSGRPGFGVYLIVQFVANALPHWICPSS